MTDAKPTPEERAERFWSERFPVDSVTGCAALAAEIRAAQAEVFDGIAMDLMGAECGYDECDHDDCGAVRMIAKDCQKRAAALREGKHDRREADGGGAGVMARRGPESSLAIQRWEAPGPPLRAARRPPYPDRITPIANALRDRPGEWALIQTCSGQDAAPHQANYIGGRLGREFEVERRKLRIYARFVGSAEIRAAQAEGRAAGLEEAARMAEESTNLTQYDDYKALYSSLALLIRERAAALREGK